MKMFVRIVAIAWLGVTLLAIVGGIALIWITAGYETMIETFRLRGLVAYGVIFLALLPPVLLLVSGKRWRAWRRWKKWATHRHKGHSKSP